MENRLWELFCDTGDPLGWLLYLAAVRQQKILPSTLTPAKSCKEDAE